MQFGHQGAAGLTESLHKPSISRVPNTTIKKGSETEAIIPTLASLQMNIFRFYKTLILGYSPSASAPPQKLITLLCH